MQLVAKDRITPETSAAVHGTVEQNHVFLTAKWMNEPRLTSGHTLVLSSAALPPSNGKLISFCKLKHPYHPSSFFYLR